MLLPARRWILLASALVFVLATPAFAGAKNHGPGSPQGNGLGAGGVPALRDRVVFLEGLVHQLTDRVSNLEQANDALESRVDQLETRVDTLEAATARATDNDGDGFSEDLGDCNDADPSVHPGAAENPATPFDDNCNGSLVN